MTGIHEAIAVSMKTSWYPLVSMGGVFYGYRLKSGTPRGLGVFRFYGIHAMDTGSPHTCQGLQPYGIHIIYII